MELVVLAVTKSIPNCLYRNLMFLYNFLNFFSPSSNEVAVMKISTCINTSKKEMKNEKNIQKKRKKIKKKERERGGYRSSCLHPLCNVCRDPI